MRQNGAKSEADRNHARHEVDLPRITETSDSSRKSALGSGSVPAPSFRSAASQPVGDTSRGPAVEPHRRRHASDTRADRSPSTASPQVGDHQNDAMWHASSPARGSASPAGSSAALDQGMHESFVHGKSADQPAAPPTRVTRSKTGNTKPKIYTDGTVRYGLSCSIC
jgi:hypothetical protein